MNRRQTLGVIELSGQTVIEQLVVRLTSRYPAISESTVSSVVRDVHSRYDGRPLRDFVPLFVERHAKSEFERLTATVSTRPKCTGCVVSLAAVRVHFGQRHPPRRSPLARDGKLLAAR